MSTFGLQTNGIYVHTDDVTGLEGFQEVLGRRRRGKNKGRMAKLIASELRGSEESGDEEAMIMSKPKCDTQKDRKTNCDLLHWKLRIHLTVCLLKRHLMLMETITRMSSLH